MESRVSNREANFDEFKKSQDEFRISQAKFRAEVKATNDLILLQLKLLAEKLGVESSTATPTHQPFIKSTSSISLVKSNQVVLKLQSFHQEKIRARERVDEFWSQFRPKYKPKSPPCLRPTLKKFKRVRNYTKYHEDGSAKFRSSSKFQESFGFFRRELAGKNEMVFDLVNKKTEDSVMGSLVLDSDCMKSKIQACILGSAFLVSSVQKSNFTDHGYGRVASVKERSKSPDFSISDGIVIDFPIRFDVGFILDAKQKLIPADVGGVHLGHNVFDELLHSTNNCVLHLGYHMPISDSGGTPITGHFTFKFQVKDAYNSKFLVCNGEFLQNGTTDLWDEIELVVSNFCDKKSDESKILAVGFVGVYQCMNAQPSKKLVGMYAHHVSVGMQQTVKIVSLKLGFHVSIRDKGGTIFFSEFNSMIFLAICELGFVLNVKKRIFLEEADPLIVLVETTFLAFNLFDKMWLSSCCMCYWKGIQDTGGGSKFRVQRDRVTMVWVSLPVVGLFLVWWWTGLATVKADYIMYRDSTQPAAARVGDLLRRMTLEEKIGQRVQITRSVAFIDTMKTYFISSVLSGGGSVLIL